MDRLQRLNASFLIGTDEMNTLNVQFLGLMIQFTDSPDLLAKLGFVFSPYDSANTLIYGV